MSARDDILNIADENAVSNAQVWNRLTQPIKDRLTTWASNQSIAQGSPEFRKTARRKLIALERARAHRQQMPTVPVSWTFDTDWTVTVTDADTTTDDDVVRLQVEITNPGGDVVWSDDVQIVNPPILMVDPDNGDITLGSGRKVREDPAAVLQADVVRIAKKQVERLELS